MKILHLTHTDIRYDNRIIKEIEALAIVDNWELLGVGVAFDEGGAENRLSHIQADIRTLDLGSRKWSTRLSIVRHAFIFLELFIRSIRISFKFKPDVIHCHDTLVLPIGFFLKLVRKKSKLVYDAHELESDKNGQSKSLSKITLWIERFCWHKIDFLITVSPSILNWYNNNLGIKRGEVILNSPHIEKTVLSGSKRNFKNKYFHSKYSIESESLVFIYVGALTQGRCIDVLLEAFTEERINSHIVFVGFGPLKGEIVSASQKYPNIHYHEPVTHDLVVELASNADVGLCMIENISLSDYFCLPNKLFEYSFSRLPILASNFPDISEVVDKYQLGKYCDVTQESIKRAIVEIQSTRLYSSQQDLTPLSWESQEVKLKNIYHTLQ